MASALPEDVLRKIFVIAYDEHRSTFRDGLTGFHVNPIENVRDTAPHEKLVATLSAVGHSWRTIVESTSLLWTHITCPLGDSDAADAIALRRLERALTFSKPHPLLVRLTLDTAYGRYGDTGISLSVLTLMPHLHRISDFIAVVKQNVDPTTNPLVQGQNILSKPNLIDAFRTLWRTNPILLLPRVLSADNLPFANLRTLVLRDVLFTRLSHLVFLLQHCTELHELTLHGLADDMILDKQPNMHFSLEKLNMLFIDCSHLSVMSRVGLYSPKLVCLEVVNVESKLQPECDHMGHCHHENEIDWNFAKGITNLLLCRYSDMAVMHILHDLDEITRLGLLACQAGMFLMRVLCCPVPANLMELDEGVPLPKLKELTIWDGDLGDEDVKLLLEERDSTKTPEVETLNLILNGCHNLTKKSVVALAETGRGTCKGIRT